MRMTSEVSLEIVSIIPSGKLEYQVVTEDHVDLRADTVIIFHMPEGEEVLGIVREKEKSGENVLMYVDITPQRAEAFNHLLTEEISIWGSL